MYLAPLALVPSATFYTLARLAAKAVGLDVADHSAPALEASLADAFGSVVLAPVVETLLLAALLRVLSSTSLRPETSAGVSAVLWGTFHGLFGALWFFGTAWSFFVFSCGYIAWRRPSFGHAFLAAAVPHALVNSVVILLLWAAQSAV